MDLLKSLGCSHMPELNCSCSGLPISFLHPFLYCLSIFPVGWYNPIIGGVHQLSGRQKDSTFSTGALSAAHLGCGHEIMICSFPIIIIKGFVTIETEVS